MSIIYWQCVLTPDQYALLLAGATKPIAHRAQPSWYEDVPSAKEAVLRHNARTDNMMAQWVEHLTYESDVAQSWIDTDKVPYPYNSDPKEKEYIPDIATHRDCLHHDVRAIALNGMDLAMEALAHSQPHDFNQQHDLLKTLDAKSFTRLEPVDEVTVQAWLNR